MIYFQLKVICTSRILSKARKMRIGKNILIMLFATVISFAHPATAQQEKTFRQPRIDDVRLDWCWSWTVKDCGKRVADTFCSRRHYTVAKDFRAEKAGGRTRF